MPARNLERGVDPLELQCRAVVGVDHQAEPAVELLEPGDDLLELGLRLGDVGGCRAADTSHAERAREREQEKSDDDSLTLHLSLGTVAPTKRRGASGGRC